MTNLSHKDTALNHLAAVVQTAHHLDAIHRSEVPGTKSEIAAGYDRIRQGLKIAEVHALLAIAEALNTEPTERCVKGNGLWCPLHEVEHHPLGVTM